MTLERWHIDIIVIIKKKETTNNKKAPETHFLPQYEWNTKITGTREVRKNNIVISSTISTTVLSTILSMILSETRKNFEWTT